VINKAQGDATSIRLIAEATAAAVTAVAEALAKEGGQQAANLKVAEQYVNAFAYLAKTNNTHIVPTNMGDLATLITSAMTVLDRTKLAQAKPA
jgi:regulator of protease activity HflC (stomatin/prohibitin superfamily)